MAKKKTYRVVRAISTADKDGNVVHLGRENEGKLADVLTAKRLAELVEAGVLEVDEVEEEAARGTVKP